MITDIFARRYADVPLRSQYFEEDRRFMNQAAVMLMDPLWTGHKTDKVSDIAEAGLKSSHDILALELGREYLSDRYWFQKYTFNGNTNTQAHTYSYANICKNFLIKMPDDVAKGDDKSNLLFGPSVGCRVGDSQSVRLTYVRLDSLNDVGADTHTLALSWAFRF